MTESRPLAVSASWIVTREGSPRGATIVGVERDDKILQVLAERPARTAEIAERAGLSLAAVKRGLLHLKEAGYVYAPTRGVYRLAGRALSEAAASAQHERPPAPSAPPELPAAPVPTVAAPGAVEEVPASPVPPVAAPPPAYEPLPPGSIRPTASGPGSGGEPLPERSWRRTRTIRVAGDPTVPAASVQPPADPSASGEPPAPRAGLPGWVALVGGGAVVVAIAVAAYLLSGARGAPPPEAQPTLTGDPWGPALGRRW